MDARAATAAARSSSAARDELFVSHRGAGRQTSTALRPGHAAIALDPRTSTSTASSTAARCSASATGRARSRPRPGDRPVAGGSEGWDYARQIGRRPADHRPAPDGGWHGVIDAATGRKILQFGSAPRASTRSPARCSPWRGQLDRRRAATTVTQLTGPTRWSCGARSARSPTPAGSWPPTGWPARPGGALTGQGRRLISVSPARRAARSASASASSTRVQVAARTRSRLYAV